MSEEDIAHGWKVHDALMSNLGAKTFRVLSREPGLTFSTIVDSWITWEEGRPDGGTQQEKVQQFLSCFYEER